MFRSAFLLATVLLAVGCKSPPPAEPAQAAGPTPAPTTEPTSATAADEPTECRFAACETGEACATRGGQFVGDPPCFARAAEACGALDCAHGCNIHHGSPKQVLCAPNAASSSNMERCAGFANWACPENMRCEVPEDAGFDDDARGICVPE